MERIHDRLKLLSHVHSIDWAMHLDEGTPHIHGHHVFDCENRYGEICPQQERLEAQKPEGEKREERLTQSEAGIEGAEA